MSETVTIYGKKTCPYTIKARNVYERKGFTIEYRDVLANDDDLKKMLVLTNGERLVPVIIEGDEIKIGFGGT